MDLQKQQQERPPQHQDRQPGRESAMKPEPITEDPEYRGAEKLRGKVALITGGDSGIGRAVALAFAAEGADIAIAYLNEHEDAAHTKQRVEAHGRRCLTIAGDVGDPIHCENVVRQVVESLGQLDILVNNAAEQHVRDRFSEITNEQLQRTFQTNVFSMFYLTRAALPHLGNGSAIINTTSVTAYEGKPGLIDYSSTKGAIVAFTRSLAMELAEQNIRVNGVAPGPIWTPLIPATFAADKVESFGEGKPLGRAGQPFEVAPSYVFLASKDSSYMTGQVLHPNGGTVVAG